MIHKISNCLRITSSFRIKRRLFVSLSSYLLGLSMIILVIWLLYPALRTYAYLGLDYIFVGSNVDQTASIAWGDMDGDGDLDMAAGNRGGTNKIFQNDGNGVFTLTWESDDHKNTSTVAWGDMDGDGDLDLGVGNYGGVNQVYQNNGSSNFSLAWQSGDEEDTTTSIAWGDMDGDGDLDLAVGNSTEVNKVYRNDAMGGFDLVWSGNPIGGIKDTRSIAWGDMDGDGLLDLVFGNGLGDYGAGETNEIYRNTGNSNFIRSWNSDEDNHTSSVALGDMDGDGDLDLAVGNYGLGGGAHPPSEVNQVYENDGRGDLSLVWTEAAENARHTESAAWGDMDGDGHLDLAFGNGEPPYYIPPPQWHRNQVYRYVGGEAVFVKVWESPDQRGTNSVAWGDMDGDGDLDLAAGNSRSTTGEINQVYRNEGVDVFVPYWNSSSEPYITRGGSLGGYR